MNNYERIFGEVADEIPNMAIIYVRKRRQAGQYDVMLGTEEQQQVDGMDQKIAMSVVKTAMQMEMTKIALTPRAVGNAADSVAEAMKNMSPEEALLRAEKAEKQLGDLSTHLNNKLDDRTAKDIYLGKNTAEKFPEYNPVYDSQMSHLEFLRNYIKDNTENKANAISASVKKSPGVSQATEPITEKVAISADAMANAFNKRIQFIEDLPAGDPRTKKLLDKTVRQSENIALTAYGNVGREGIKEDLDPIKEKLYDEQVEVGDLMALLADKARSNYKE